MTIRIRKPSLDDEVYEGNPVLRGVIVPESLVELRIDNSYQRELLSQSTRRYILSALAKNHRLPDLELGMRGDTFHFEGGDVVLEDPVYIIDGQQRRGTILEFMATNPEAEIRQGGLIHFSTTVEWERARFHDLNLHHTNVSGSLILRNLRNDSPALATIYGLARTDKSFPLYDRIGWQQTMRVKDLVSGVSYCKYALGVHSYLTSGLASSAVKLMVPAFKKVEEVIGLPKFRSNVKQFWTIVDDAFGVENLTTRGAVWLKTTFLMSLCDLLARHEDFWDDDRLLISSENLDRLSSLPVGDPEVVRLSASSGVSRATLLYLMVEHLNKGRSRGRLVARDWAELTLNRRKAAARSLHRRDDDDDKPLIHR